MRFFEVFMKSNRVPMTILGQLFGHMGLLRSQLVYLGGHFECQEVTLGPSEVTLSN